MESNPYWELFCATGDPMAYLLYCREEMAQEEIKG